MVATSKVLLLVIRKEEVEETLDSEFMELLRCHQFDHLDLQSRLVALGSDKHPVEFKAVEEFL